MQVRHRRTTLVQKGKSAATLGALLAITSLSATTALADTWDNSNVAAPIVNNGVTIDGDLSDWGVAGTNYTAFGPWHQWYDGSGSGYPDYPVNGSGGTGTASVTTSRVAIDTVNNRLLTGIQTTQNAASIEIAGLFGGTYFSIDGQRVNRAGAPNTGTQLFVELPNDMTNPTTGTFSDPEPSTYTPGTFGAYDVMQGGISVDPSADITGATGAYSYDGTFSYVELSLPVKLNWALADASGANTYNLNDLAGLVGGSGANNLNIAYAVMFFAEDEGYIGDSQNARFDGNTSTYGNANGYVDYWDLRAVNAAGVGPNIAGYPNGPEQSLTYGGLTLLGEPLPVPEPASLALVAAGGLMMIRRRRSA